jgi:hypothetical protein
VRVAEAIEKHAAAGILDYRMLSSSLKAGLAEGSG